MRFETAFAIESVRMFAVFHIAEPDVAESLPTQFQKDGVGFAYYRAGAGRSSQVAGKKDRGFPFETGCSKAGLPGG